MNNRKTLPPSLCIDLKKNRIRIHRHTLRLLGNPKYIQILVNPSDGKIALRKSDRKDYLAHKIYHSTEDCIEIYSSALIENLMAVNENLIFNRSYRLYGNIDVRSEMVLFSIKESILIEEQ
ncbi:MAG: hypothetical protein LIO87_02360 [Eubacterium sp.]|nr:hypothetical protein [Eubacterium sp.]